ncbi:MAG TPA: endonuclease domain-containing protein [Bryobacteraceae bacterium]|nr:endonuclease domain-containing protein [Bryobacteraceae bacterium]
MSLVSKIYSAVPNKPLTNSGLSTKAKWVLARQMKSNPTPPERLLWKELKSLRKEGIFFSRQLVLHGWIVDFYCAKYRLIIEVDGKIHNREGNRRRDTERDEVLRSKGFRTVRVTAKSVFKNAAKVLNRIRSEWASCPGIENPPAGDQGMQADAADSQDVGARNPQ